MNRRNFVKSLFFFGSAGLLSTFGRIITGCATGHGPNPPTAGRNHYFKGPGRQRESFLMNIREGYSPGVDWKIPVRTPILACAKGKVIRIRNIRIRAGGDLVQLQHASNVSASFSAVLDSVYRTDHGTRHLTRGVFHSFSVGKRIG